METVYDLATALDRQSQIDLIFLDLEKAFGHVSYSKLLLKLEPILMDDTLCNWIEAYMSV